MMFGLSSNKGGNTIRRVWELAEPLAKELGVSIWDVVFEKEGANWYLRVFIDRDEGIDLDICEAFSRPFSKMLDEADPIEQSYILEVGSVGLARELKRPEHFERFIGSPVRVRLIRAQNGVKEFIAKLLAYNKDGITLSAGEEEFEISLKDTAFVKLCDDEDIEDELFE